MRNLLWAFLYPVLIATIEFNLNAERLITWGTASVVGVGAFLLSMTILPLDWTLLSAISPSVARWTVSYLAGVVTTALLMLLSAFLAARELPPDDPADVF